MLFCQKRLFFDGFSSCQEKQSKSEIHPKIIFLLGTFLFLHRFPSGCLFFSGEKSPGCLEPVP